MLNPDPKQRALLGWPIRWIAALLMLLVTVAAAVPTNGFGSADPGLDARSGTLHAPNEDEHVAIGDLGAATSELLGSKSSSDSEIEESATDTTAFSASFALPSSRARCLDRPSDVRAVQSLEACGRRPTRAPPIA